MSLYSLHRRRQIEEKKRLEKEAQAALVNPQKDEGKERIERPPKVKK